MSVRLRDFGASRHKTSGGFESSCPAVSQSHSPIRGGKSTKKFGIRNVEIEKFDEVNVELFAIAGSNSHWKNYNLYH